MRYRIRPIEKQLEARGDSRKLSFLADSLIRAIKDLKQQAQAMEQTDPSQAKKILTHLAHAVQEVHVDVLSPLGIT